MDEDISIINTNTRNEKIKNFFIKNKKYLIIILSLIILIIFFYFAYGEVQDRKTKSLSEKYNSIVVNFEISNKQIFKKKGTISFRASDIFNSQISRSTTRTDSFENYTEFQWRAPTYILRLTYRINENKSKRRRNSRQYNPDGQELESGD